MNKKPQTNDINIQKLGHAVAARKKESKLSYRKLEAACGVKYPTLHHIVEADVDSITIPNFMRIVKWLGQAPEEFINGVSAETLKLPLFQARVSAGKGEMTLDQSSQEFELLPALVNLKKANQTFLVRVTGDSMEGEGIFDGDLLVVERAEEALPGEIVIANVEGQMYVKRLIQSGKKRVLRSANPGYPDIAIPAKEKPIQGRVTFAIRHLAQT
ncbi:MAG: S24 family peptidase [Acidobacteria bacterium]|nr:S24 family peptidase [Acidobacteriota bacterium]